MNALVNKQPNEFDVNILTASLYYVFLKGLIEITSSSIIDIFIITPGPMSIPTMQCLPFYCPACGLSVHGRESIVTCFTDVSG